MLTNIKIKNAYSIKEMELSLLKGKFTYKKEMIYHDVVSPIVVYGNNGSGKSNLVNVMNDLLNLLIKDRDDFYPFIANFNHKKEETLVELTFKLEEDIYKYSVVTSFTHSKIVNETLLKNNAPVFTRNEEIIVVEDKEYLVEDKLFLGLRQLYILAKELNSSKEDIKRAYDYLINISVIKGDNSTCNSRLCNYHTIEDLMVENSEEVKQVISNFKDFPLYDFIKNNEGYYLNVYSRDNSKLEIPVFLASSGMIVMSKILSILVNLDRDSLLVIDGVEKNLHPSAILHLIKEARKRDIQLIFTSHNTSLMQELRPDQIYFARIYNNESYYFRLASIYDNIRKINNIEKMYLSNTFENAINEIVKVKE